MGAAALAKRVAGRAAARLTYGVGDAANDRPAVGGRWKRNGVAVASLVAGAGAGAGVAVEPVLGAK